MTTDQPRVAHQPHRVGPRPRDPRRQPTRRATRHPRAPTRPRRPTHPPRAATRPPLAPPPPRARPPAPTTPPAPTPTGPGPRARRDARAALPDRIDAHGSSDTNMCSILVSGTAFCNPFPMISALGRSRQQQSLELGDADLGELRQAGGGVVLGGEQHAGQAGVAARAGRTPAAAPSPTRVTRAA